LREPHIMTQKAHIPPLSKDQQDALYKLDQTATDMLSASLVVDVVGVIAGIKPAAFLEEGEKQKNLIKALGLCFTSMEQGMATISWSQERADELAELMNDMRADDDLERKIGLLLGYPPTATEYFIVRSRMEILPPFVEPEPGPGIPNENYLQFVLSPENYEEEVRMYAAPLEAATIQLAPRAHAVFVKYTEDSLAKKHKDS